MKKLLQLLALEDKRTDGDLGIEIEVEGGNLPMVMDGGWRSEHDGSLRDENGRPGGGMEYIFREPVHFAKVEGMLEYLKDVFKKKQARINFSFRTSVHVHLNVQQLTYPQLLNLIYTYLLIEEPMMNLCGEHRKGNRFCLRMVDSEGGMPHIEKLFSNNRDKFPGIPQDAIRYSALNLEALLKYGSVEFRAMQGNLDIPRIMTWCTMILRLREFACKFESPAKVFEHYTKVEAQQFFVDVAGDVAQAFDSPDLVKNVQRNFSLSIDLPFLYARRGVEVKQEDAPKKAIPKFRKNNLFEKLSQMTAADRHQAIKDDVLDDLNNQNLEAEDFGADPLVGPDADEFIERNMNLIYERFSEYFRKKKAFDEAQREPAPMAVERAVRAVEARQGVLADAWQAAQVGINPDIFEQFREDFPAVMAVAPEPRGM